MDILVYTRNGLIAELREHFEARFNGIRERVRFRNAEEHLPGDLELCDAVLVDDDFPAVADDYGGAEFEGGHTPAVELFRASEVGQEPPEPSPSQQGLDREWFASPTAYDTAVEGGITPDQLAGVEPQGVTGYTTAQMRQMTEN